jgi:hypothetical protein
MQSGKFNNAFFDISGIAVKSLQTLKNEEKSGV